MIAVLHYTYISIFLPRSLEIVWFQWTFTLNIIVFQLGKTYFWPPILAHVYTTCDGHFWRSMFR